MWETLFTALIGAAVGGITAAAGALLSAWRGAQKRHHATEDGVQCLLRAELIRTYEKSRERGHCPLYRKEAAERAYAAYHALGGNDVATELYRDVMQMPDKKTESEDPSWKSYNTP